MNSLGSTYQLGTWRQGAPARGTYTQLVILGAILPSALIGHFGSKPVNLVLCLAAAAWSLLALSPGLRKRPPVMAVFVAAVAPNAGAARGIGAVLFYLMMFFAGLWLPIPDMPAVLQHISHATPLGAAVPALQNATLGQWPTWLQLVTLAGYAVAFGLAAARFFRWE